MWAIKILIVSWFTWDYTGWICVLHWGCLEQPAAAHQKYPDAGLGVVWSWWITIPHWWVSTASKTPCSQITSRRLFLALITVHDHPYLTMVNHVKNYLPCSWPVLTKTTKQDWPWLALIYKQRINNDAQQTMTGDDLCPISWETPDIVNGVWPSWS